MKKIKIAQIGTSIYGHGTIIFEALKKNTDVFDLVGYVFPENEREKFPEHMEHFEGYKELTLEEVLNDPEIEAVAIETEEIYLTKYALLAAQHNKHIHMEKPGGKDLAEFKKLIDLVKEKGNVFHVGYMYRYNPYIQKLMERIKAGELGEIVSVEAHMSGFHKEPLRRWLKTFRGGMMFYLGCHLVDLILQIQGTPKNIIPLNKSTGLDGIDSTDFGMAIFEYDNGVSFAKATDVECGGFLRRQLVVTGTKGVIEIRPLEQSVNYPGTKTGYKETFDTDWNAYSEHQFTEVFDRYDDMMQSFAQMAAGEKKNPWSYDYELELYKTILKACGGTENV